MLDELFLRVELEMTVFAGSNLVVDDFDPTTRFGQGILVTLATVVSALVVKRKLIECSEEPRCHSLLKTPFPGDALGW